MSLTSMPTPPISSSVADGFRPVAMCRRIATQISSSEPIASAAEIFPIWPVPPIMNTQTTSSVEQAKASRSISRARSARIAPPRVSCSRLEATRMNMAQ
jgi:hypothetical protein